MRLRVAEIGEHPVPHVLRHEPVEGGNAIRDPAVVCADDLAQILGIERGRERCGPDQIAEQDRKMPAFGAGRHGGLPTRDRRGGGMQGRDRVQQLAAMADQLDAEIL